MRLRYLSFFVLLLITTSTSVSLLPIASSSIGIQKLDGRLAQYFTLETASPGPKLDVVLSLSSAPTRSDLDGLRTAGFEIHSVLGNILTGSGTVSTLKEVSRLSVVQRINSPHRFFQPELDVSIPEVRASIAHSFNITGNNTIVGVVDTGIDLNHDDFKFPNGTSKIIFVWDHTDSSGPAPTGFTYGTECTTSQIQNGLCNEKDDFIGHGTHVTAIAASSGRSGSMKYGGVAPDALIIMVKLDFGMNGASDMNIIDGMNYIVGKAAALGKRAVINLSLGGHEGPHDDTSVLDLGVDNVVAMGVPVVVSAGNSGAAPIHASGTLTQGGSKSISFTTQTATYASVFLAYNKSDTLSASIQTPSGILIPGPTGNVSTVDGTVSLTRDVGAKANVWFLIIYGAGNSAGSFTLTLGGTSVTGVDRFDGYGSADASGSLSFTTSVDHTRTVSEPGTAKDAITVGAYTTRNRWPNALGGTSSIAAAVGDLAFFSSIGPTRDGRLKPDIAAPGQMVMSALSTNVAPPSPQEIDPDGKHWVLRGTSMSAPHATGVVALILSMRPAMTSLQVKQRITLGARHDSHTGVTPNNSWGYGKLNALVALPDNTAPVIHSVTRTATPRYNGTVTVTVNASDNFILDQVLLEVDDGTSTVNMTMALTAGTLARGIFTATIPPEPYNKMVHFRAIAIDSNQNQVASAGAPYTPFDDIPPLISNVTRVPNAPGSGQGVQVSAIVNEPATASGAKSVTLSYRKGSSGPWTNVTMTLTSGVWKATIPQQPSSTMITYFVSAEDNAGNFASGSSSSYTVSGAIALEPSQMLALLLTILIFAEARRSPRIARSRLIRRQHTNT